MPVDNEPPFSAARPRLPDKEVSEIDKLIDVDLYQGETADARERILGMCKKYLSNPAGEVVCPECTESPLAFSEQLDSAHFEVEGISFVNTTVAHVDAALQKALE